MAFNRLPPRRKRESMGIREPSIDRSASHLKWIRSFTCVAFESGRCEGPVHAHHIRSAATAGIGIKPSDFNVVPLCMIHHAEIHYEGCDTFSANHNLDLSALAEKLARISPHRVRTL